MTPIGWCPAPYVGRLPWVRNNSLLAFFQTTRKSGSTTFKGKSIYFRQNHSDHGPSQKLPSSSDHVHILGTGNVGRLFAYALANLPDPPQVTLLFHRESLFQQWQDASQTISLTINDTPSTSGRYKTELLSPSTTTPLQNLIITTKATKTFSALNAVSHRLTPTSNTLLTQNGMGILPSDYIEAYKTTFIPAINTHGIYSNGPFSSTFAGQAALTISEPGVPNTLVDLITSSPLLNATSVPADEFTIIQLEKLVVNACINPLTVLFNCKNGSLFTQPPITQLMRLLLSEISQLLLSLPETQAMDGNYSSEALNLPKRFSIEELELKVLDVADRTALNTSSMLQDVQAGRETEIDYITGYILRRGKECGVDMHFNEQVYTMVQSGRTLKAEDVADEFGGGGGYLGALFDPVGWLDPRGLN